jgi:hypothetical protein
MDSTTDSALNFILFVLGEAKKELGDKCRYIGRTRALKLICIIANDIGFNEIPRGWYKHGLYSFKVDSILRMILRDNLLSTTIPPSQIDEELGGKIIHFVKYRKDQFVVPRKEFFNWIHLDLPPQPYKLFYKHNDEFYQGRQNLIFPKNVTFIHSYDILSDIITDLNHTLKHVRRDYLDIYFDYSDILEDLLLVMKRRGYDSSLLRQNFIELDGLYEDLIYSCLTPFEESAVGVDRNDEIATFTGVSNTRIRDASSKLWGINENMKLNRLKPTLSEYKEEILPQTNS